MSATNGIIQERSYLADECVIYRNSLAAMIRQRGTLTTEERAHLQESGVVFDPETEKVHWLPRDGQTQDLDTERDSLVKAVYLFLEPPEPITEEELVEARTTALTFEAMAAELGLNSLPERQEAE